MHHLLPQSLFFYSEYVSDRFRQAPPKLWCLSIVQKAPTRIITTVQPPQCKSVWTVSFNSYYNKTVHRSHNKSPILANLLNRFHPQCSYFNWHKSVVTSRRIAGAIHQALSPDRCHATYRRECEPFADVKRFMYDAHTEQFLQQPPSKIPMKSALVRLFHIWQKF